MGTTQSSDTGSVLRAWRARILSGLLAILAVAATPAWAMSVLAVAQTPERRPLIALFLAAFAILVALAVFRRLDSRIRAWGLLVASYGMAAANLAIGGISSAGPWYLLVLPVLTLILAGRASLATVSAGDENATESASPAALLDPAALERLREMAGGDAGFLKEMFETLLADAPGMLAEMRQSLEQGDAATRRRAAHSMKSNSADFGARALSELCRELEMMGKAGTLDGAPEKLASIEAEWARVRAAMVVHIKAPSA